MNDIFIVHCVMTYIVIGIITSWCITKKLWANKKFNRHGVSLDKFADEHGLEIFHIMLLWPLYICTMLFVLLYACVMRRFKR